MTILSSSYLISVVLCKFWILIPWLKYDWFKIFSHAVGSLLTLMIVSLVVQKLFNFHIVHLLILGLIPEFLLFHWKSSCLLQYLEGYSYPVFFLRCYNISFWIMIFGSFLNDFCTSQKTGSNFIRWVEIHYCQHRLLNGFFFCHKWVDLVLSFYFWACDSVLWISPSILMLVPGL